MFQWISQYQIYTTNFTEAAIFILAAGQVYCHKVKFLEEMVLNMEKHAIIEGIR